MDTKSFFLTGSLSDYRTKKVLLCAHYLKLNLPHKPSASVEVTLHTSSVKIRGCNAIIRLLARLYPIKQLFGAGFTEIAKCEEWIDYIALELEPFVELLLETKKRNTSDIADQEKLIKSKFAEKISHVEESLNEKRTYLISDNLTLADICLISVLFEPLAKFPKLIPKDAALWQYYRMMSEVESVDEIFGHNLHEQDENMEVGVCNFDDVRKKLEHTGTNDMKQFLNNYGLWQVK
eukprot:UN30281